MAVFKQGPRPEDHYLMVTNKLARDPGIALRTKGVYLFMRSHKDGWHMTVERIAKALEVSKETISKSIKELEEAGYIVRDQAKGKDGKFSSIEYLILSDPCPRNPDTVLPSTVSPDTENRPTKEDYSSKKTIPEGDQSSSVDEPGPDGFKEFWDHYPRKIGKGKAETYYREQLQATTPDVLLNAVKNFATECRIQQTEKRYIPYPSTWLNQGRWKDYNVAPPKPKPQVPADDFDMDHVLSLMQGGQQ